MADIFEFSDVINTGGGAVADLLDANDTLYVAPGVQLASESDGDCVVAEATGGVNVVCEGAIYGGTDGIVFNNGENSITIGAGGSVTSGFFVGSNAIIMGGADQISNAGTIFGENGINIVGFDNSIVNSGTIAAIDDCIALEGGGNSIDNSGTIDSATPDAAGIVFGSGISGDGDNILNSGTIEVSATAIQETTDVNLTVHNSGTISGALAIAFDTPSATTDVLDNSGTVETSLAGGTAIEDNGAGSLTVVNSGHIAGAISFGSGDNVYDGTLGSIAGTVTAGAGSNVFYGGAGNETFDLSQGADTVDAGGGNDVLKLGANFSASQSIDGGAGKDTVTLNGDYSAGVVLGAGSLTDVEKISFHTGFSYTLTMDDGNVAAGAQLNVDASALASANVLKFDGSAETDGRYVVTGGAGNDFITGGDGNDVLSGGGGNNHFTGGAGADRITAISGEHDHFIYTDVNDSTSSMHDILAGFDGSLDKFDLDVAVTGMSAEVASGRLSKASLDANLATAITSGHLAAGHAVLFTPTTGNLAGHTFLIVDANGVAGYQAGADYVFDLVTPANLNHLTASTFI